MQCLSQVSCHMHEQSTRKPECTCRLPSVAHTRLSRHNNVQIVPLRSAFACAVSDIVNVQGELYTYHEMLFLLHNMPQDQLHQPNCQFAIVVLR